MIEDRKTLQVSSLEAHYVKLVSPETGPILTPGMKVEELFLEVH